ncbi:hypothetical protein VNO80_01757 [Phaseolus coccineus]|uniref:Carrier domain-containing protein n=1 Tax=Phaseolus coccineus TaxID=3886 RepID=A0AAN9RT53_PHACN
MSDSPLPFFTIEEKPQTVKVCDIVKKQLALSEDSTVKEESKFAAPGADSLDTLLLFRWCSCGRWKLPGQGHNIPKRSGGLKATKCSPKSWKFNCYSL